MLILAIIAASLLLLLVLSYKDRESALVALLTVLFICLSTAATVSAVDVTTPLRDIAGKLLQITVLAIAAGAWIYMVIKSNKN